MVTNAYKPEAYSEEIQRCGERGEDRLKIVTIAVLTVTQKNKLTRHANTIVSSVSCYRPGNVKLEEWKYEL